MINSNQELGLRVESIVPQPYMINIDVNSPIDIKFNCDLNTSTIIGNFAIVQDPNLMFTSISDLKNGSNFIAVPGNVIYKNSTISFYSTTPLLRNARYIVAIKANSIKDILGHTMLTDYVSSFYTSSDITLPACNITSPAFGTVTDRIPTFKWDDVLTPCYVFQMSKEPTFESLICDTTIKSISALTLAVPSISPELELNDGLYYVRTKAINGIWSEPLQFFFKNNANLVSNLEDIPEGLLLTEDSQDEYEVLEVFPKDCDTMVDTKVKIIYVKYRGIISIEDINLNESTVTGILADSTESDDIPVVIPQGQLIGTWNVITDAVENVTYVIFSPNVLS